MLVVTRVLVIGRWGSIGPHYIWCFQGFSSVTRKIQKREASMSRRDDAEVLKYQQSIEGVRRRIRCCLVNVVDFIRQSVYVPGRRRTTEGAATDYVTFWGIFNCDLSELFS